MLLALDTANNFSQFFMLLLIFAFVLAVTYFTTKYIANFQKGKLSEANIKVIEGFRLSQTKYLEIVKIGSRYFCLALCKDSVSVVCELSEDELVFKEEAAGIQNFSSILDKIKNMKSENQTDISNALDTDNEEASQEEKDKE